MTDTRSRRTVIFVGGTPFSGSTAFHLMLANDASAFACGELDKLFFPASQGHVQRLENCPPEAYRLWREVLRKGAGQAYTSLFEQLPEVNLLVDSSKNAFWIHDQSAQLRRAGVDVRHLLIWKSPEEFASSWRKRRALQEWVSAWTSYHRLYSTLIDDWRAVRYRDLGQGPRETLQSVCRATGVGYFEGKEEFWRKEHFHLGGNYAARMHLVEEEKVKEFAALPGAMNKEGLYRKVYYQPVVDSELLAAVARDVANSPHIGPILRLLESRDVRSEAQPAMTPAGVRIGFAELAARRTWHRVSETAAHWKYAGKMRAALSGRSVRTNRH